ncbi:MAG: hypothetical protein GJ680_00565 [Alteromonadaceae bacterium]|nr:hypothetical protein [Alteromonadaceae bacterium]
MPLTPLGIVHTVVGIAAIISLIMCLVKYKHITLKSRAGKIYLLATLITAASALGIFQHGGFNAAHLLGILTLLAVIVGWLLSFFRLFGKLTPYFQLTAYSSTILFHALPTATEIMTRFPPSSPIVSGLDDPLLQKTFLIILCVFVIFLLWQLNWLRNKRKYE